jgi:hypothetical protein
MINTLRQNHQWLIPQELVIILAFSVPTMDVIFTCTPVTRNAIVEITDSFLYVLATNAFWRVFVATVASETTVLVAHMTGHTTRIVIAV